MNQENDANRKKYEHVIQNEFPVYIQMLERNLDFTRWGFRLTHAGIFPQYLPYIIYESSQCKIRFRWEQDRPDEGPATYVNYGRLHAPIDQNFMLWNGEKCYCWHEVAKALNFLDGLSPADTTNSEFRLPHIMREFSELEEGQDLGQAYLIKMHSYIWEHYGQNLFDLFDLSRPDLWDRYSSFLEQYYKHRDDQLKLAKKRPSLITPPLYRVC